MVPALLELTVRWGVLAACCAVTVCEEVRKAGHSVVETVEAAIVVSKAPYLRLKT